MATPPPVFSFLRRRRPPLTASSFAPVDISDLPLVRALAALSAELISSADTTIRFQCKNSRSLVRKVRSFLSLFEFLRDSLRPEDPLPKPANLCFKELYILFHRVKTLLDYCSQSCRLWLLLKNTQISGLFHDITLEIGTLLDVFPFRDLSLSPDVVEQVELLRRQTRRSRIHIDPEDEQLRLKIHSFLQQFETGTAPDPVDLRETFVAKLGLRDARACRIEVEFLEEQIYNHEEGVDLSLLEGVAALTRYCRFLLFGFGETADFRKAVSFSCKNSMKGMVLTEVGESFVAIPKDYCCPISLELMTDPVIVSTGQTYDRASITRWMDEGHSTCPNSGQTLTHKILVPNRALRSLISQWCISNGVAYDPPAATDGGGGTSDGGTTVGLSKGALGANRATVNLLVKLLQIGSEDAKATAARELRLMAKTRKENRAYIVEAGAVPFLRPLLSSTNPVAQENSVTAILNLSIHDQNKAVIMEEEGCLKSIVDVLVRGCSTEAMENAAATLFSLSAVHEYKKRITDEEGAVEALAGLLRDGTPRGKKDAVMAMFNLSTHSESCLKMVDAGAASALAEALETEGVAEEAAGAMALLVRQQVASEAVAGDEKAVRGLVGLMRQGSPKAKENAVSALVEMCRSGGAPVTVRVASAPAVSGLIQTLLFTGTKRARRKAASLARLFQKYQAGSWVELSALRRTGSRRGARHSSGEVPEVSTVSAPVAISVPVL